MSVILTELNSRYHFTTQDTAQIDDESHSYNCMGFAFGSYEWDGIEDYGYEVYDDEWDDYREADDEEMEELLDIAVNEVLEFSGCNYDEFDYPFIRFLEYTKDHSSNYFIDELKNEEYLVAMRMSDDDFHFMRRMKDGKWYHKPGCMEIRAVDEEEVYDEWNWCGEYVGDIAMFAVRPRNKA